MNAYLTSLIAVVTREALRFVQQRERFVAALVRPLVWLIVFAAGFRAALGLSIAFFTDPSGVRVELTEGLDRL